MCRSGWWVLVKILSTDVIDGMPPCKSPSERVDGGWSDVVRSYGNVTLSTCQEDLAHVRREGGRDTEGAAGA